jgi:arabinofuranosyltransferase
VTGTCQSHGCSEEIVKDASELFESAEHRPAFLVGVAAVIAGLCLAAWASWTCDDAFISFRYARNLVEGHGLVFNVGERVEGYTNLLWTLWIAVGLRLGVGAEPWSGVFGLLSYGVSLVLLFSFHLDLRRTLPVRRATLPLACLVGAVHPDWRSFATSGLETSAFTAVVLAGYVALAAGLVARRLRPLLLGTIFGVASLLCADGLVFGAVAAGAVLLAGPRRIRDTAWFMLGVGVFWAGETAFRAAYYGQYFSNTYYAKSASLAWPLQGLVYLGTYLHKYWPMLAGPLGVVFIAWKERRVSATAVDASRWFRTHAALATAFAVVYTYYVVRVGGDFMYARLLIPATPYLALLFELGLYRLSLTRQLAYVEVSAALLLLLLLIPRPVTATEWKDGIRDEPAVYDDAYVVKAARTAEVVANFFKGLNVRVAFLGKEARLMYQANVPIAIEADTGRTGATKRANVSYLVSTRAVHFLFAAAGPEELGLDTYIPVATVQLGTVKAWVLHWDPELMAELKRRGALLTDFGDYLDGYLDTMAARSPQEVQTDYLKFRHFYFDHVTDPRREAPFIAEIRP